MMPETEEKVQVGQENSISLRGWCQLDRRGFELQDFH